MPMQKPLTTAEKAAIERRIARKKGPYSRVNPRAIGMAREAAMAFLEVDIRTISLTGMNSLLQFRAR